jgi:hypothetical protein
MTKRWIAIALALALGALLARQETRIASLEAEVNGLRNAGDGNVMLDAALGRLKL